MMGKGRCRNAHLGVPLSLSLPPSLPPSVSPVCARGGRLRQRPVNSVIGKGNVGRFARAHGYGRLRVRVDRPTARLPSSIHMCVPRAGWARDANMRCMACLACRLPLPTAYRHPSRPAGSNSMSDRPAPAHRRTHKQRRQQAARKKRNARATTERASERAEQSR